MERLSVWLLFGVLFSLLPLGLDWARRIDDQKPHGLVQLCQNGELLLIAAVIAGGALGELFISRAAGLRIARVWAAGSALLLLAGDASWYSDVSIKLASNAPPDPHSIAYGSLASFGLTILASGACLAISSRNPVENV